MEHTVDAVADAELRLLRLDVNVGRALTIGFGDDLVHEADDRGLLAHLVDVDLRHRAELFADVVTAVLKHLLNRLGADAVELLHGLLDLFLRRKDRLDADARDEPKPVRRLRVERIGRDNRQRIGVNAERQHVELRDGGRRQFLQGVRIRILLLEINALKPQHLADGEKEILLLHAAELDGRFRQTHAGIRRPLGGNALQRPARIDAGRAEDDRGQ